MLKSDFFLQLKHFFGIHIPRFGAVLLFLLLSFPIFSSTKSKLFENIRIDSKILGYVLQYRVYLPDVDSKNLPVMYLTDGQMYLAQGGIVDILNDQIEKGHIPPIAVVFVDSRNPENLMNNRRNSQFQCNQKYAKFFASELIPAIDANFPTSPNRKNRSIGGLSFGGLNAACFGLMLHPYFSHIAMQSPANKEHIKLLHKLYNKEEKLPISMFMSVGTKRDNTKSTRKFHKLLQKKGYKVDYYEVPFGHTWDNWKPLIDDMLSSFVGSLD